jgi:hypothetical protein
MTTVERKLVLPEELAREAEALGLLTPEALERLLRKEIRQSHVERLFEAADRLAALPAPALTAAEVEAEIQAARQEKRAAHAGRA